MAKCYHAPLDLVRCIEKSSFGPLDANVTMGDDGAPQRVTLALRDGTLSASIVPDGGLFAIALQGKGWRVPIGAPVLFDELTLKGAATATNFKTRTLTARLYGGTVNGNALLSWHKGVRLHGAFDVNQWDVASLAALAAANTRVSGRLNAKPVVSAAATTFAQLGAARGGAVSGWQWRAARRGYSQGGDEFYHQGFQRRNAL